MTSEEKKIIAGLEQETGSLNALLQQQDRFEALVNDQLDLDAVFIIDLFNELHRQIKLHGLKSLQEQSKAVFYFEEDVNVLNR